MNRQRKSRFLAGLDQWESQEESPIPVRMPGVDPDEKFRDGLLDLHPFEALPPGERVLVSNTAREMPIEIVDPETGYPLNGFRLGADGHVTFGVRLQHPSYLPSEDVQTFFVYVLFVPASEIVYKQAIGSKERELLTTVLGLRFDFEMPGLNKFLKKWQTKLQNEGQESVILPKTTFVLNVWWD